MSNVLCVRFQHCREKRDLQDDGPRWIGVLVKKMSL